MIYRKTLLKAIIVTACSSVLYSDEVLPESSLQTNMTPDVNTTVSIKSFPIDPLKLIGKNYKAYASSLFVQLRRTADVKAFYSNGLHAKSPLAWFNGSFKPSEQAREMMRQIEESYNHGFNPEKYHFSDLKSVLETIEQDNFASSEEKHKAYSQADVWLSDAFMTLSWDHYYGFTNWDKFKLYGAQKTSQITAKKGEKEKAEDKFVWSRPKKVPLHPLPYLTKALSKQEVARFINTLKPDFEEYRKMQEALKHYRELNAQAEPELIPEGPTIRINSSDPRLDAVKKRLHAFGDLKEIENEGNTVYNENSLIEAVKSFQAKRNFNPDGLIGKKTISALNQTNADKISKIILNLERFRWISQLFDKYPAYIDVNIPSYHMRIYEYGKPVMRMKVIVGQKARPTPILSSKLASAVLNPSWTAPSTIVKEDILKKGKVEKYLQSHDMRVYANQDGEMVEVDADEINWKSYEGKEGAPFVFKADAGKDNPLGTMKFLFGNKYSIYMHDTNQRWLFNNDYRALSSGCIRLAEPKKLLSYLLQKDDRILAKELKDKVAQDAYIPLKKRPALFIRYMTVGVDENNKTHFYEDIYGYDARHKSAMQESDIKL